MSPLPFGVLPPGFCTLYEGEGEGKGVSIAFRRSAPWLLENPNSPLAIWWRLHCLSAFCPLASKYNCHQTGDACTVSIAFRRSAPWLPYKALGLPTTVVPSPLPFGVLPPGFKSLLQVTPTLDPVSIAFRRSAPWLLRLPNCLAGRGRGAIQVMTAGAGRFGSCWPLAFCEDKLHKVLGFGKLKLRSGPRWFSWLNGRDLELCGWRAGGIMPAVVAGEWWAVNQPSLANRKGIIPGNRALFRSRPSCRRSWFLWRNGHQSCRR